MSAAFSGGAGLGLEKEVNWIGQENVPFVNTPFLFYSRVKTAGAGCSVPVPEQSRRESSLEVSCNFLNLAFSPATGHDLQVLGLVLEAVLKLTWFSPLTACWVNSKPTCSSLAVE